MKGKCQTSSIMCCLVVKYFVVCSCVYLKHVLTSVIRVLDGACLVVCVLCI